jgi:hypothetical protein
LRNHSNLLDCCTRHRFLNLSCNRHTVPHRLVLLKCCAVTSFPKDMQMEAH